MQWIGTSSDEQKQMLDAIGASSFEELVQAVPRQLGRLLNLPAALSEPELLRHLSELAEQNSPVGPGRSFLGGGAYEHAIPAAIDCLISRGEFTTSYTPYQAEVSQGTLMATFEFQTMIAEITGMDVANASMYDGASAAAEAALLAIRQTRRNRVVLSGAVHPEWQQVVRTYLAGAGAEVLVADLAGGVTDPENCHKAVEGAACLIVQQPNFLGQLEDVAVLSEIAHQAGALCVAACNPVSLGVLAPPGETGADIAAGDIQPLGIPLSYGGPYGGFFAVREKLLRQMPGRLVGMTEDHDGRRGFTLTLQTREQHIRRERATSNICSNQALMALACTIYLALVGPEGFRDIAHQNLVRAHRAAEAFAAVPGVSLAFDGAFFNEFVLRLNIPAADAVNRMRERGYLAGLDLGQYREQWRNLLMVCVTETKSAQDVTRYAQALQEVLS